MATLDLDPIFVKALRLLHSKARDSADQLKQMLNDALHSTGQDSKEGVTSSLKLSLSSGKKSSPKPHSSDSSQHSAKKAAALKEEHLKKKAEVEKRAFEKLKQDLTELGQETVTKKPRLDPPKLVPPIKLPVPPATNIKTETPLSGSAEDNASASDIALEMGLACIACRSFDVAPGNTLVECQDCHTLYHQECHRPPITEQDVNDPRLVWYCAKCTKNIKKLASKNQKTSGKSSSSSSSSLAPVKETITIIKPIKAEPVQPSQPSANVFKRVEPKVASSSLASNSSSGGSSSGSANKPIGLAGLAASLSGKSHPIVKPTSSSINSNKPLSLTIKTVVTSAGVSTVATGLKSSVISSSSTGSASLPKRDAFSALVASSGKTSSSTSGGGSSSSSGSSSTFVSSKPTASSSSSASSATSLLAATLASSSTGSSGAGAAATVSKASSSLMSADKRLQNMKKKAAAKMQEKRRLSAK